MSIAKFQKILDKEGIKYFSASEVCYLGGSNGRLKLNSHPPEDLWPNIIPTLKVLDQLRAQVGPLLITSAYRNKAYNTAVGGERNSYHMRFVACDVIPLKVTVAQLYREAIKLRASGFFKGGIGRYPSFVHIDTRGVNADW